MALSTVFSPDAGGIELSTADDTSLSAVEGVVGWSVDDGALLGSGKGEGAVMVLEKNETSCNNNEIRVQTFESLK
jgi:hypothetical protein